MSVTLGNLYLNLRRTLMDIDSPMASLEAREIVRAATGYDEDDILRLGQMYVSDDQELTCRNLLNRRRSGEPLAYILAEWSFYDLELFITPDVLVPRQDTEVLVDVGLKKAEIQGGEVRILDLCCGSGCVGLALASHLPNSRVVMADISDAALQVAQKNIVRLGLDNVSCVKQDCLSVPVRALGCFDIILANPPYVTTSEWLELDLSVRDYEPRLALDGGVDGLVYYRAICECFVDRLNPDGFLAFECGLGQAGQVGNIMLRGGVCELETYKDTAGIERVVAGQVVAY